MKSIATRQIDWDAWRIIPSRNPPIDLYRRIAPVEDWSSIIKVELLTNPRVREMREGLGLVRPEDMSGGATQNWILAPFTYLNPEGTRFSDGTYGTCFLSEMFGAALSESIRLREKFLRSTAQSSTRLDMRVIKTTVKGMFDDATMLSASENDVAHKKFWKERQRDGCDGVYFHLNSRSNCCCVEAFRPRFLTKATQERHLTYTWDGQTIVQVYDFLEGKNIDLERLRSDGEVLHIENPLSVGRSSVQSG